MSTRRDILRVIGGSAVIGNTALAQHVHAVLAEAKSLSGGAGYQPKCFTSHNFLTLKKLADLIIPGANDAGAGEYIDLLSSRNPDLAAIFNGGFGWLADYMPDFLTAKPEQQTALMDHWTSGKSEFWVWTRNMVVDAYYTSPVGVQDLGYMGNTVLSHFSVPQEAVDYVMKRSPI